MSVAVGLAGAGRRATQVYASLLASSTGVRFSGVWARTAAAADKLGTQYGVPSYDRFHDLLAECEAVSFAVPPAIQVELATIAARQHKAVLLEQPLANDLAGAEELVAEVEAARVVSQLALTWRYSSAVREFLGAGVRHTRPLGGRGRLISASLARRPSLPPWRIERGVLLDQGADLIDILDAALGPVVGVHAHGDPLGWVGLLLDHSGGKFSEASLCATARVEPRRAGVEVFGPGGASAVDCTSAVGPEAFRTMLEEFATAAEQRIPHDLDARRGLHLQRILDSAETDLFTNA